MTYETCLKQAENCKKNNDEEGALMYEARAARKKSFNAEYYENQAKACEARNNPSSALKWRAISEEKGLIEKKTKSTGKK